MRDAAGIDLTCSANDLSLTSFSITSVGDTCTDAGDTMTFDGVFHIAPGSTDRYDIGLYVGLDGSQALTGPCNVSIIPQSAGDLDGDACGDVHSGTAYSIPVSNVVATCADSDGDGYFDLAVCASYDNNAGGTCSGPQDAYPPNGSKCQCGRVGTDLAVPHCSTNAECADDGNPCTTEVCNPPGSGAGNLFGCSHDDNADPCDDGLYCNGSDTCGAGSCSVHSGSPCSGGPGCDNACDESTHGCLAPAGAVCRAAVGVCDAAEVCDGSSRDCPEDAHMPADAPCDDDSNVCTDDVCDGSGNCLHAANAASCEDGLFCNGDDFCAGGTCEHTGDPCADGPTCSDTCNELAKDCYAPDGTGCEEPCTIPGTGACTDGVCIGTDTLMAPSCRWIVIAGVGPTPDGKTVKTTSLNSNAHSWAGGSVCGDHARKVKGSMSGHYVVAARPGEGRRGLGIKFKTGSDVYGSIATGGATIGTDKLGLIPGTSLSFLGSGLVVAKLDELLNRTGFTIDTTGNSVLTTACNSDRDALGQAVASLDALPSTVYLDQFKLKRRNTQQINAVGPGPTVIDAATFKVGGKATLLLNGSATDVIVIRAARDLKFGSGASLELTGGLTANNVLIYGRGSRCKFSSRVTGEGTIFCPTAKTLAFGYGAHWTGTVLGGTKEIALKTGVTLEHEAFTGL